MGIYYLSGVGLSPGSAMIPLHYIYLMLKMARGENPKAQNFFKHSGEADEKDKGSPECIILFTSREVIKGTKKPEKLRDDWFNIRLSEQKHVPQIMLKSLNSLIEKCELTELFNKINGIFFIAVNYNDFKDCYQKIYTTIKAFSKKEVWINLVGGSNQINLSLFLSSCLTGIGTKFIYIFQEAISKIHPDIPKPNFKNPNIQIPPQNWQELPFFWIGLEHKILQDIENKFSQRPIVNKKEILSILDHHIINHQYLKKLQSANLIDFDLKTKDKIHKGNGFQIIKELELSTNVKNFAGERIYQYHAIKHRIIYHNNNSKYYWILA
ncbi:MAG: hypothetical protein ACTSR8_21645 [Promethearchaeota archaeon]